MKQHISLFNYWNWIQVLRYLSSRSKHERLSFRKPIEKSNVLLKTYTDERMKVNGELPVEVRCGEQCEQFSLVVVAGDGPSLFGRNWLQHIQLDWKSIKAVTNARQTWEALNK